MTIKTHDLNMSYLADTQLISELINDEGNIPVAYADSRGIATIGIGVNITISDNMALVLDQLGVFTTYINNVNADRTANNLPLLTTEESNVIYTGIVDDFESVVSSIVISGNGNSGSSTSEKILKDALEVKLRDYLNDPTSQFILSVDQAKAVTREIITGYSVGLFEDKKGKQGRLVSYPVERHTYSYC